MRESDAPRRNDYGDGGGGKLGPKANTAALFDTVPLQELPRCAGRNGSPSIFI